MGDVHQFQSYESKIIEEIRDYVKSKEGKLAGLVIGVLNTDGTVEYLDITDHPMTALWILRITQLNIELDNV